MTTNKSFTDISQSKKLAEILPIKSADFHFSANISPKGYLEKPIWGNPECANYNAHPCWSLAALLDVIPEGIIESYYAPYLQKEDGEYSIAYGSDKLLCIANNPIDACYEMIVKLHKLKML